MRLIPYIIMFFAALLFIIKSRAQPAFTEMTELAGIVHHHSGFMYGAGAAVGDFNTDGYLDIYIPSGKGYRNRLYINNGNLTFSEKAYAAGVADQDGEGLGAVCADIDNDGDTDIYVANHFDPNRLFINDGGGNFTDVAASAGVADNGPGTSAALFDYDNDGLLDIYLNNRAPRNSSITNKLFRNNGDGTFTDITQQAMVGYHGYSLGVAVCDYDNDNDPDIYIADEFAVDCLYRNSGDGTYTNISDSISLEIGDGMGVDFGDYDNDGDFDIYVANYLTDFLLQNNGDGTFTDLAFQSGIINYGIGWAVDFFDCENDGDKDLYVVNGAMIFVAREEPNPLYINNGNGTFTNMNFPYAVADSGDGRGGVCADFNNDGSVDLFVINVSRGQSKLFVNNSNGNNWITLRLEGNQSNRSAVGARVAVWAGGKRQIDEVRAGSSYASMHSLDLEFGIGQANVIDSILIRWPSGGEQKLSGVAVNQILNITESPTGIAPPGIELIPGQFTLMQNYPNPFNNGTVIRFQLPQSGTAQLEIVNTLGQAVWVFEEVFENAGEHTFRWDGRNQFGTDAPSGIYVYRLHYRGADGRHYEKANKMLLIK